MKKINILYIALFFLLATSIFSCTKSKQEEAALSYLSVARKYFYANEFDKAHLVLDSLPIKYPSAFGAKAWAEVLRDSVLRDEHSAYIDSISERINQNKIQILKLITEKGFSKEEIKNLQKENDSLQNAKTPHFNLINMIVDKELLKAAKTQCITCIKK